MNTETYNQALKYLSLRAHTVFELRQKLLKKKFSKPEIQEVLDELMKMKYLNDEDFASVFVHNLVKYKSFGYYGIKAKLMQRGIANDISEKVLGEELSLEQERKIADKAVSKSSKTDAMKLAQMLQRKGFRSQVISEVVKGIDQD